MAVLLAAAVAFQLNASMLSPVLTTMAHELGTDEAAVGLTQTAFFTGGAMCGLFLPRLSDIVGRRKILLIMLSVMALGGVIAALAPNIGVLMFARALQGIAGPTIPMTLIILRSQVKTRFASVLCLVLSPLLTVVSLVWTYWSPVGWRSTGLPLCLLAHCHRGLYRRSDGRCVGSGI